MKIIKFTIIILVLIVALCLIIAAFLPSVYYVERSIEIQMPVDSVFYMLVDLTQRYRWDPWLEKEPTAKSEISGSMQGLGAVWSWEGESIGAGYLEIKEVQENVCIKNLLVFETPKPGEADVTWNLESILDKTTVTWAIQGNLDYPIGRLMGLMMDRFIGPDFERGLSNLKNELEGNL